MKSTEKKKKDSRFFEMKKSLRRIEKILDDWKNCRREKSWDSEDAAFQVRMQMLEDIVKAALVVPSSAKRPPKKK